MALVKTETFSHSFTGMSRLPVLRQVGLLIGLAAAIAIGVSVVLWTQAPGYALLYGGLTDRDAAEITGALQRGGIPYKLDQRTGGLMVPSGQVREARLQLAGEGLPRSSGVGYEILQQEQGFGTSRALESARFQRALEVELSRTIGALTNVRSARVHLALPKPSVFVRDRNRPSASVLINLEPGRVLEPGQVEAVVYLVSSSVPELATGDVKVVNQKGRLLTTPGDDRNLALTSGQFKMTRDLEQSYVRRIESILQPLVGRDGVRAEVTADLDFSIVERTQESFNPDLPAVRSEQTVEEQTQGVAGAAGIPGALSNQPPGAANAPEVAALGAEGALPAPANTSRRVVRNYELDRTISSTRLGGGVIRRLSVAVLVDDSVAVGEDGQATRTPRSQEELDRLSALVREAVGFSERRGDTVSVISASFTPPEAIAAPPEPAIWERPWVIDLVKQLGGAVLVLIVAFGVLRPMLRSLAEKGRQPERQLVTMSPTGEMVPVAEGQMRAAGSAPGAGDGVAAGGGPRQLGAPQHDQYKVSMEAARAIVKEDPKRVAQVVKAWVASDG